MLLLPLISSAGTGPERAELDDQPLARRGTSHLERLAGGLERGGRSIAANDDSVDRLAAVHRCPLPRFLGRPAAVGVRLLADGPARVVVAGLSGGGELPRPVVGGLGDRLLRSRHSADRLRARVSVILVKRAQDREYDDHHPDGPRDSEQHRAQAASARPVVALGHRRHLPILSTRRVRVSSLSRKPAPRRFRFRPEAEAPGSPPLLSRLGGEAAHPLTGAAVAVSPARVALFQTAFPDE